MFSFSKADRFPEMKKSNSCCSFYDLPPVKTRTTSLGMGQKYDFTKESKGNNPQFYNFQTDFDPKKPQHPAFSFGIGRDKYDKVYYESNKYFDKDVPGPGKYDFLKKFGHDAKKFSIYGKVEPKNELKTSREPGPGEYPLISINPSGKYPLSHMKNTNNLNWSSVKDQRFIYTFDKNPGPDKYDLKSLINGKGFNYVSKYKSSTAKSLYGKPKDVDSKYHYPGPGSYRQFSEFGIYESKTANHSQAQTMPHSPHK